MFQTIWELWAMWELLPEWLRLLGKWVKSREVKAERGPPDVTLEGASCNTDHGQLRDQNLGDELMGLTDIIVEWFLKQYFYVPQLTTAMHI